jgi:hypothetical protein
VLFFPSLHRRCRSSTFLVPQIVSLLHLSIEAFYHKKQTPASAMQLTHLLASALLGFSALSTAHPGEHHQEPSQEAALQLRDFKANARRGLESCADK